MINNKVTGFSLLELMLAMFLSLIIIAGTAAAYLSSKRSYEEVESIARLTQNSRFAVQIISEALIHAGFMGELPAGSIELDANLDPIAGTDCTGYAAAYELEHTILATISNDSGDVFGCIKDAVPDTGAILIKNVQPMKITDSNNDGNVDSPFTLSGSNQKYTYVMANNSRGLLFDGMDIAPAIKQGGDIPGGNAWQYQFQIYYVRGPLSETPRLSRKSLLWNGKAMALSTEDLIEGVENMNFLLGSDSNADGDIDIYRTSEEISAEGWTDIAAIRISLLVRSDTEDVQYTDIKEYDLGGITSIGPLHDHYHRMLMQSSVSLRNPKFVIRGNL